MSCIAFWKSKKNLNPIIMKRYCSDLPPDDDEKKIINERKKDKRNGKN